MFSLVLYILSGFFQPCLFLKQLLTVFFLRGMMFETCLEQLMERIVYTGGTFDLIHAGHVKFLEQCAKYGKVVVALNTDEFVKEYKNCTPIMTLEERFTVMSAIRHVDCVVVNTGGADSKPSIVEVNPDIIAIGSDWADKDYYKQMGFTQEWLDNRNIELKYIPYTEGISTTQLKKRFVLQ